MAIPHTVSTNEASGEAELAVCQQAQIKLPSKIKPGTIGVTLTFGK